MRPRQDRRFLTALHVESQIRIVETRPLRNGWRIREKEQPHRLHKIAVRARCRCARCVDNKAAKLRRAAFAAADSMIEATQ